MLQQQIIHLFAPWHALYSESKVVPIVTEASHMLAMLMGGGFAVAADRATLRLSHKRIERRESQLVELHEVHRPVLIALAISFITGVLLAGSDIEAFIAAPTFWAKLGLVTLLLLNGALFVHTESRLHKLQHQPDVVEARRERLWRQLRLVSLISMVLWSATLVASVVLVNGA